MNDTPAVRRDLPSVCKVGGLVLIMYKPQFVLFVKSCGNGSHGLIFVYLRITMRF